MVDHGEIVISDPELGVVRPVFAGILVPGLYLQPDLHLLSRDIHFLHHEREIALYPVERQRGRLQRDPARVADEIVDIDGGVPPQKPNL